MVAKSRSGNLNFGLTSYGACIIFRTLTTLPTVTTAPITAISQTKVTSGGNATSDGGAEITARGVCWSISSNPTIFNNKTIDGTGIGAFTSNLTELTQGTNYFARAYATNRLGTSYGNPISFSTSPGLPSLTTNSVSSITQTTASSGGNISNDGGASITSHGVCWATDTDFPTKDYPHTNDGTGSGSFTSILTGLISNTRYFVRAYATNSKGTSYGNPITFKTLQPTLTTTSISAITQTTALSGGNITNESGENIIARGVCWAIDTDEPTTAHPKTLDGTGSGSFISNLTGLTGNTRYFVRAYATSNTETNYGNPVSFKTSPVLPTLTTTSISSITQTIASSGGDITSDGGDSITARGVFWSTSSNPTIANTRTIDGTGSGAFSSILTGLIVNTTFFVRAYATNSVVTGYGENRGILFYDGRAYACLTIGNQIWMTENLAYLPTIGPSSSGLDFSPHYYVNGYSGNNVGDAKATVNYTTYGVLYNWEAAKSSCPSVWHLPSDAEWTELTGYLGSNAGKKMKSTSGWLENGNGDNSSGFNALPGGTCNFDGRSFSLGLSAVFWSASEFDALSAWYRGLNNYGIGVGQYYNTRSLGFSVRCIKD